MAASEDGIYWIARGVPEALRDRVGVAVYQRTLSTEDLAEPRTCIADAWARMNGQ